MPIYVFKCEQCKKAEEIEIMMDSLIMSSYMEYEDLGDIDDSAVPTEALEDKVVTFKFSGKKNK